MTDLNPYQSPTLPAEASPAPFRQPSAFVGTCFLLASTIAALAYTYVDEAVAKTQFGAWPTLFGTSFFAIASALVSRHPWLAPLACFIATMAADLFAAYLVSIRYAQIDYCFALALAFSCPALVVALFLRKRA